MNDLIQKATAAIARLLSTRLPDLSPDWWQKLVLERLSFHQQRTAHERGFKTLQQLDFASLLRILDQNWYELSDPLSLPREARSWVKELQTVRNKWAHLSAESMPASETYRGGFALRRLRVVSLGGFALSAFVFCFAWPEKAWRLRGVSLGGFKASAFVFCCAWHEKAGERKYQGRGGT